MAASSSTPNPPPQRKPLAAVIIVGIAIAVGIVAIIVTQGGAPAG